MNSITARLSGLLAITAALLAPNPSVAAEKGFTAKKHEKGVTVSLDGELFVEYVLGSANKPYLWPVIGPTGKPVTRAYPMQKIAGEQTDHLHHRGIWFGHQDINGVDTWYERPSLMEGKNKEGLSKRLAIVGTIQHREFKEVSAKGGVARIVSLNDHLDGSGAKYMAEERRLTFRTEGGTRVMDFDIEFTADVGDVTFGDMKDAGFSIRVPTEMAVDTKKGGKILNSEGHTDKDAWAKRAKWCDYTGPVEGETVGFTMLNHPDSFRFPTYWHVRTYGLFTANPFGTKSLDPKAESGVHVLKKGEKLLLRHRILIHKGELTPTQINAAWDKYAAGK